MIIDDFIKNGPPPDETSDQQNNNEQRGQGQSRVANYARSRAQQFATDRAKQFAKKGAQKLTQMVGRQVIMGARRAAVTVVTSSGPWGWIIAGIVIFLILLIIFFGNFSGGDSGIEAEITPPPVVGTPQFPPIPGFSLELTGPTSRDNGQTIPYTITYTYDESAAGAPPLDSITIYDALPTNTTFVSATGDYENSGGTISWALSNTTNRSNLTLTLRPNDDDIVVSNKVYARTTAAIGAGGGENLPPNNDTCDGKYTLGNPLGNFGDPACNFSKDALYALLKSLDPQNADKWYYKIVPCESTYVPNAHNPLAVDSAGAWGLFQMGRGKNGQYDRGDLPWQTQASNAVNYNALINGSFAYWACAR